MSKEAVFSRGDVVYTNKDEKDIEWIPANTRITLGERSKCKVSDEYLWSGSAVLYGTPRPVLVYESNLRSAHS